MGAYDISIRYHAGKSACLCPCAVRGCSPPGCRACRSDTGRRAASRGVCYPCGWSLLLERGRWHCFNPAGTDVPGRPRLDPRARFPGEGRWPSLITAQGMVCPIVVSIRPRQCRGWVGDGDKAARAALSPTTSRQGQGNEVLLPVLILFRGFSRSINQTFPRARKSHGSAGPACDVGVAVVHPRLPLRRSRCNPVVPPRLAFGTCLEEIVCSRSAAPGKGAPWPAGAIDLTR
jgi:hypothetical protein